MVSRKLRRTWARAEAQLQSAVAVLPADADEDAHFAQYREYIDHNEFGLALDQLEMLGTRYEVPPCYWQSLSGAADEMGLDEAIDRFRRRAQDAAG